MRLSGTGILELYSADREWVEGAGSDVKDKSNHPIFHIQSFIGSIFPDIGVNQWELSVPVHTALARTYLETALIEDNRGDTSDTSDTGDTRRLYYLLPIFTEGLIMLSGAKFLANTDINRLAIARLIGALHISGRNHVLSVACSDFTETLQLRFCMPIRDAYVEASVRFRRAARGSPQAIINGKMKARKRIREGAAKSRSVAMTLISRHKELSDIVETLFHKMTKIVADLRYSHLDTLIGNSDDPWDASTEDCETGGQQLQGWQFREAIGFYNRLRAMRCECDEFQLDYEDAIRDIFFHSQGGLK